MPDYVTSQHSVLHNPVWQIEGEPTAQLAESQEQLMQLNTPAEAAATAPPPTQSSVSPSPFMPFTRRLRSLGVPYASAMAAAAAPSCVCTSFRALPPVAASVSTTSATTDLQQRQQLKVRTTKYRCNGSAGV